LVLLFRPAERYKVNNALSREAALFAAAINLPVRERAAYLAGVCEGEAKLRQRVERLLLIHDQAGEFLEQPPQELAMQNQQLASAGEKPGDRIGRYKLLQQIGEGGCGMVYMAEQQEPVWRRVALKIIKRGMDTKSVIARFEAERQALALMDHPNIAKVFDAGATDSGRPYFVMELVRGVKITDYCDQNFLRTEERLVLFFQVCRAVQHAHQKGIIHRDIKPSNILVTKSVEGASLPVVIDFGIAKATGNQRLTEKTLFTAFEMLIGTPAYMSPEQAELSSADVDTRTDIYSLGVLLYELVTGSTPFDGGDLMKAGLDEIRRAIREREPDRPSTRLSRMTGADLTSTAERRQSAPPTLIRSVRGDLDWIVMKALEKDRTRRYETANDLALDVQRFLANEPIVARPPSALYKFRKTVLRNKTLFGGLSIIAILLIVSLATVTASLARERQARRKAQTEEAKSRQVTRFLKDMLEGVGPSVARGRDTVMLREILDRTAERIVGEIGNQPAVEAELCSLIGRLYLEIGVYDEAEQMQRVALVIYRKLAGLKSAEAASALNDLGQVLWKERKLAEAATLHEEALVIRRQLLGNEHPDVAVSLNNLAGVYRRLKKLAEAESLTREALDIRRRLFGNESLEVADSLRSLSIIFGDERKRTESEATAREVLTMRRKLLGPKHPLVAAALNDVAWAAGYVGKSEESESLEREALAMRRQLLGEEHPDVARSLYLVGDRVRSRNKLDESRALLSAALSMQRKLLGDDKDDTLDSLRSLGLTLDAQGRLAEAEAMHREALVLTRKRGGNEAPQVLAESESLVRVLMAQKKIGEAEKVLNEMLTPGLVSQPSSVNLLVLRIDLMGRQSRWPEAAADAALALEHQPTNHERYHTLAALLAINGNRAACARLCARILAAFANTTDAYVADRMAKDCLLLPSSGMDLAAVGRLADTAVTVGKDKPGMPFFQVCKALSEYRQGHFPEAIDWAEQSLKSFQVYAQAQACAVLAMAQWRMGEKDTARAALAKGDKLTPKTLPERDAEGAEGEWLGWIFARVWLDEAVELTESGDK
jgi:serine/threonine protein kinase